MKEKLGGVGLLILEKRRLRRRGNLPAVFHCVMDWGRQRNASRSCIVLPRIPL